MNPTLKLHLKVFLFTGIPFALMMSLIDLWKGEGFNFWLFLLMAMFFGGAMSLTMVDWHLSELRRLGINSPSKEDLKSHQVKEIETGFSRNELKKMIKKYIVVNNMKVLEEEPEILLRTRPSWRSWGEKMKIGFIDSENGSQKIRISSEPLWKIAYMDYGKNKENVELLSKVLLS